MSDAPLPSVPSAAPALDAGGAQALDWFTRLQVSAIGGSPCHSVPPGPSPPAGNLLDVLVPQAAGVSSPGGTPMASNVSHRTC